MGCGVSKIPPSDIPTDLLDTNDPPETNLMWADADEAIEEFADDGEPGCAIGTQCKAFEPGKRNVVILFGGVGSHKGDLTDLMASEYSFQLICMEELLLRRGRLDLAEKEAAELESAPNIEEAEGTDSTPTAGDSEHSSPSHIEASAQESGHTSEAVYHMACNRECTLANVMRMVVDEIDAKSVSHSNFVIDFVPNHRELAKSKIFASSGNVLARFDRSELNIKFALLLEHSPREVEPTPTIPKDTSMSASSPTQAEKRSSTKLGKGSASSLKHKKKAGDEHDKSKTSRRSQTLMCMSEPFVQTFEIAQRLVKIKCPEFAATNMLSRFKTGMKELGFKRRHGAWRLYLALAGLGQSKPPASTIYPKDLVGSKRSSGNEDEISLMDVIDALPRRFNNDDEDRAIVVDFSNIPYSTSECLRVDKDVQHHPTMDDPHLADAAFCEPVPDVYSFEIGNELEVFLPKCTDPDLCAAIVSRLAFKFHTPHNY